MAGFEFAYTIHGNEPMTQTLNVKDAGDHTGGLLGNIETGEVDIAATADTDLCGLILAAATPGQNLADLADTSPVRVILDPLAVYKITDNNARVVGATLDLSGGGAVTSTSNADLVVVAASSATEKTYVKIANSQHVFMAD